MRNNIGLAISALALSVSQGLQAQQADTLDTIDKNDIKKDIEVVEVTGNQQVLNPLNPGDLSLIHI